MRGSVSRQCWCRDPQTGRRYRKGCCPKDASPGHARWYGRFNGRNDHGRRRQLRVGPFRTKAEAEEELRSEIARVTAGGTPAARTLTVGRYFEEWLRRRASALRSTTYADYRTIIEIFIVPGLGAIRLIDLNVIDLEEMYAAMMRVGREGAEHSPMLARLLDNRTERSAQRRPVPVSASRVHKVHAVIRSGLHAARRAGLITDDPASRVVLPRLIPEKPLVWTRPRVDSWRRTGEKPAKVMVWTPEQCRGFLEAIRRREERWYALYHLAMTRGLRRSELCNLRWVDVDLEDTGTLAVVGRWEDEPKTPRSRRVIHLGADNITELRSWRARQQRENLSYGDGWKGGTKVFTEPDGSDLRPELLTSRFATLVRSLGVPPIRLHDLRHCSASLGLMAGVDLKTISEYLGHRRYEFTADTYTNVMPRGEREAAEAVCQLVSKRETGDAGTE